MAGNNLLDFLQGASNSAASNVSAPVDGIAWLLRKAGLDIQNPVGGSDWMHSKGLTAEPQNKLAGVLGESFGGVAPMLAASKANQLAKVLNQMGENAQMPTILNKQAGVIKVADLPYQIEHKPMTIEGGAAPLHDLAQSFGDDVYGKNAMQYFGSGDPREAAILKMMAKVKGSPDAPVTIYRGVPDGVSSINQGDWVSLHPDVASDYGKVISQQVPASHITAWPDSLMEFGYYPPK